MKHQSLFHFLRRAALWLLLLSIALSAAPSPALAAETQAESPDYRTWLQTVYTKDNGLPCGSANDIAVTADGLLWIGTYAGLYRANGSNFQLMQEYDTVKNVNTLYVDDQDRLCVGTNDSGLSIFHKEKLIGSIDTSQGLPSDSVRSIVKAANGSYYVGTADSLVVLSVQDGITITATVDAVKYASRLSADGKGNVAATTTQGALYILRDGRVVADIQPDELYFSACFFDADGTLYVGTTTGDLLCYRLNVDRLEKTDKRACPGAGEIQCLYRTDGNTLFICSDKGIGYFAGKQNYLHIENTSFNNSVDNMTTDYQGNLWFSSSRLGVLRLCSTDFSNLFDEYGVSSGVANTVEEYQGLLYVGTDTGLTVLDRSQRTAVENEVTEALAGIRIRQIFRDSQNTLWLCTYGKGLISYDGSSLRYYNTPEQGLGNRVRTVMQKRDGTIVASGDNGVALIQNGEVKTLITADDGLPGAQPLCLLEGSDGSILAGTDGSGIARIASDGSITLTGKQQGLSSEVVLRMVPDSAGKGIFVITSNGLCYLETDGTVRVLNQFPYSNNFDMVEQDGRLLVLGSAGIYVVEREELLANQPDMKYTVLDSKMGLLHSLTANAWTYHDKENKKLYLPTNFGVTAFDMGTYDHSQQAYILRIAQVLADGIPIDTEGKKSFSFDSSIQKLEITPEIVNFSISNPIISCYLEGFDTAPILMNQSNLTTLVYTNLPAGEYRFHLAIVDADTGAVVDEQIYEVERSRAFYENIWFILAMFLCVAALSIYIGVRITNARYRKKLEEQSRALELSRRQIEMSNETIVTIAKTVDAKDSYTSQHSSRVAEYSVKIAKELGYTQEQCDALQKIALLHDIGKIGVPDSVLNKPGRLTDEEYATMKTHVIYGAEILKDFTLVDHVDDGVRYHHERYDGRGYPNGLRGTEIPLTARIIGVADAFDAMTSNRIYRNALDMADVLAEMQRCKGTQFDPQIADILIRLVESGEIDPTASVKI